MARDPGGFASELGRINPIRTHQIMSRTDIERRESLLHTLEARMEVPMFFLAFVWLWLLFQELTTGLSEFQRTLGTVIWLAFIIEFALKLLVSPDKVTFFKNNWLTAIAIMVPALRMFRLFNALAILGGARVFSGVNFVRALTTGRRVLGEIRDAQGHIPAPEMNVGVLIAHSVGTSKDDLQKFAEAVLPRLREVLETTTRLGWTFIMTSPIVLRSDEPRVASEFVEEASLAMTQGPYDAVIVITDVTVTSQVREVQAGVASELCRIIVMSTRKLMSAPRGEPERDLHAKDVLVDGVNLLLRLFGYTFGLALNSEDPQSVMSAQSESAQHRDVRHYTHNERRTLEDRVRQLPERELHGGGLFASFIFHFVMILRHPWLALRSVIRSRALLLPFALPSLATAAVAPTFLLIFTAEIWDVGLTMENTTVALYAVCSVLGATLYLMNAQSLLLPRQEKRVLTEHLAVANCVIFISVFIGLCSLFVLVGALMLVMELYVFPADLMSSWQTTEVRRVDFMDQVRLAAFIATVGVTTGALAGGFETRAVLRNLRLFHEGG